MPQLHFVLPGPIDTATGGYRYDRHLVRELRALGWDVQVHELPARFPFPDAASLAAAAGTFAALPDGALVLVDGLALGVLPDVVAPQSRRLHLAALVHHPLHAESGLDETQQRAFFDCERRALTHARRVFVTSPATAAMMRASGLLEQDPCVAVPGTEPAPVRAASSATFTRLLCVATLTPRKDHALLFEALAALRELPWSLDCVGSTDLHPPTTVALRALVDRLHLGSRVRLLGECSPQSLREKHLSADLFVLASRFEGYGMAVAEALAQGVPVVATRTGAAESLVGDAGIVVEPGDRDALTDALRALLSDPVRRERHAAVARLRSSSLPRWQDAARLFARELAAVAG